MRDDVGRPKISWKIVKELEEEGIVVQVSESETPRPKYTVRVGRRREDTVLQFVPLFIDGDGQGHVAVRSIAATVAKLLVAAEAFVQEKAQQREDEWAQRQLERGAAGGGKRRRPVY